jgi:NAD(P)-dependent dehydrogenase (short-subunit alcohol dehydrogenase family)
MSQEVEELFDVSGQVVAVTGAAGVIYSTVSRGLAENGARVALLDVRGDRVEEIAADIRSEGGEAIGIECNVLDTESIQNALDGILERYGSCHALINGAGGNRKGACVPADGNFTDLPTEEIDKVFELNYRGTLLPTQIFCKYFAGQGEGTIINTSSMTARAALTNVPGYSNAKAAVSNLTRWLAVQVRVDFPDADIRVNEIAPGFLDTEQNHDLLFEPDDETLTERGESIISHTPLDRFGDPEELLGPILMLLSRAGSFLQGVTLCIDGGFDAYSGVGPLDEKEQD